ncbi:hypothetical protein UPYG_G00211650 [Umbra pygmaea]|uniref:Synaptonemal complex central element protein 3 n=1 Tax=Umbra pygmaea TaxID=75934 RepID=A0ABD0X632_UMBPY
MAHSSSEDHHQNCAGETMQMDKELERMIEDVESISVQLTWMAYDMVVLRTDPDLGVSLRKLEEEFLHCRAVICGSPEEKELNQALRQEEDQGIHEAGPSTGIWDVAGERIGDS